MKHSYTRFQQVVEVANTVTGTQNQSPYTLNIIPFRHLAGEHVFSFTAKKEPDLYPLKSNSLPRELTEGNCSQRIPDGIEYLYTDFTDECGEFTLSVDLRKNHRFAKHYYNWCIKQYFQGRADITNPNFILDNVVWVEDSTRSNEDWKVYEKYAIRVYIRRFSDGPEIAVSYEGTSRVLCRSIMDVEDPSWLKWVVYKGQLYRYRSLPAEALYNLQNVFPVLNHTLRSHLMIKLPFERCSNKYKKYHGKILAFARDHLFTEDFKQVIPVCENQFASINRNCIFQTTRGSNELEFGQKRTDINPFLGIIKNGPFQIPGIDKPIKIIFIFHENDINIARKWFTCFRDGYKYKSRDGERLFPPLKKLIGIPIHMPDIDSEGIKTEISHITFTDRSNPLPEIRRKLSEQIINGDCRYLAIYISPYAEDELTAENERHYYRLKKCLLHLRISTQVIERDTINAKNIEYILPNIGIAILAKLDGVPWRLKRSTCNELIVGVGAFKPQGSKRRYIGSTFSFANDGSFQEFDCFPENDMRMLAGQIGKAVRSYAQQQKEIKRLIIHFYKNMSYRELKPILEVLDNLCLPDLPVIIVTINKTESEDLVIFEPGYSECMPLSGTHVNIGRDQYLLCNNTRYYSNSKPSITEGFPLPVKLSIRSTHPDAIEDSGNVKHIIDQIYQFSRVYWKSVSQQNLPVTIKYPEMVAQLFANFEDEDLPPFGKRNLWFL